MWCFNIFFDAGYGACCMEARIKSRVRVTWPWEIWNGFGTGELLKFQNEYQSFKCKRIMIVLSFLTLNVEVVNLKHVIFYIVFYTAE